MATATQIEQSMRAHPMPELRASRFDPEFEFLLSGCETELSAAAPHFNQILPSPVNWDRILKLAEYHRLLPALHASVCNWDDVPASIRSAIRARFQKHAYRVLRFQSELARILRRFADRGIPALAHKGPALGQLLYGDPAMRQFGDLDFLVRPRDVYRAKEALIELGYGPRLHLSPRRERAYLHSGYEYVFGLGAEQNLVELQWQIVPRFYAIDFDMEALFQRSIDVKLDGVSARTLGYEDLLLVLCVHAAKHQWSQAGMLRDVATLAGRQLDWPWIEAEAHRLGILKILMISLLLVRGLFCRELPWAPRMHAYSSHAEKSASAIQARLAGGVELNPESLAYFRAMVRVRERWQDRVRFTRRLAVTPSVSEWQAIKLPDTLFPLYGGIRLLRLARRFALRS